MHLVTRAMLPGLLLVAACSDAAQPIAALVKILVSLSASSIAVGQTTQASAALVDANGATTPGTPTWSASNSHATVSPTGAVTGVSEGPVFIIATGPNGLTGRDSILVTAPPPQPVASVVVTLDATTVNVGQTAQATASFLDAGNNPTTSTATWSSSNNGFATVSSNGAVTAIAPGQVSIIATAANGITGSKTLTITSVASSGLLASHNFNDGTLGPYRYLSVPADMDIIDDPTGSGRGKVVRFHYAGVAQDRNRALEFDADTHLGDSLFFKGDFYIPANASTDGSHIARKLMYWQSASWPAVPQFWAIFGVFGNEGQADNNYAKADGTGGDYLSNPIVHPLDRNWTGPGPKNMTFGVWHTIETQVYLGSAPGASDGVFRLWYDGVLLVNQTTKKWTDAAWPVAASNIKFSHYTVGDQVNGQDSVPYDEYRYWDNISFGRKRIP